VKIRSEGVLPQAPGLAGLSPAHSSLMLIKTASFVTGRWVRRLLCVFNSERPNQHNATQTERLRNPIWNCHLLRLQIRTTSLQGRARAFNPPALLVRFRSIPDGYIGDHDDPASCGRQGHHHLHLSPYMKARSNRERISPDIKSSNWSRASPSSMRCSL